MIQLQYRVFLQIKKCSDSSFGYTTEEIWWTSKVLNLPTLTVT
jgi:hypothetical protein